MYYDVLSDFQGYAFQLPEDPVNYNVLGSWGEAVRVVMKGGIGRGRRPSCGGVVTRSVQEVSPSILI